MKRKKNLLQKSNRIRSLQKNGENWDRFTANSGEDGNRLRERLSTNSVMPYNY